MAWRMLKIVASCFNMLSLHLQVPSYRFIAAVVKTCKEIKHANEILIWDKMLSYTHIGIPYEYTRMGHPIRVWADIRIWAEHCHYVTVLPSEKIQL